MTGEISRSLGTSRALVAALKRALEARDAVSILCDSNTDWIQVESATDVGHGIVEVVSPGGQATLLPWREIAAVRRRPLTDYDSI